MVAQSMSISSFAHGCDEIESRLRDGDVECALGIAQVLWAFEPEESTLRITLENILLVLEDHYPTHEASTAYDRFADLFWNDFRSNKECLLAAPSA